MFRGRSSSAFSLYPSHFLARPSALLPPTGVPASPRSSHLLSLTGHFPFGESWYNATNDKLFFTSYERDAESGNDYAVARYYISRLARFSSTDIQSGSTANPQSLNRYSYVLNDPGGLVDPSGQCGEDIETRRRRERLYNRQGGRELDYEELAEFLGLQDPPTANGCTGNNGGEGDGGGTWDGGGWGGFSWGGPGGTPGCTVQGISVPCNLVSSLAAMGAALHCPNNDCTGLRALQGPGGTATIQRWVPPAQVSVVYQGPTYDPTMYDGYWQTVGVVSDNTSDSWAWSFTKSFVKGWFTQGLSDQPGSCTAVFLNSGRSSGSSIRSFATNTTKYGPALASGLAGMGPEAESTVAAMVAGGQLTPAVGALTTNLIAGTAPLLATAAPYLVKGSGYTALALFDVVLLKGVADEVAAIKKGQCKP